MFDCIGLNESGEKLKYKTYVYSKVLGITYYNIYDFASVFIIKTVYKYYNLQ